jgi:hypothetical protein
VGEKQNHARTDRELDSHARGDGGHRDEPAFSGSWTPYSAEAVQAESPAVNPHSRTSSRWTPADGTTAHVVHCTTYEVRDAMRDDVPVTIQRTGAGDPAHTLRLLWRDPTTISRRGPRQSLNLDTVVEAAIALADAHGLDALTMRQVADALGVAPMTLYTYVPGKAELLDLMLDAAYTAMNRTDTNGQPWPARLTAIAAENKALYTAHPWAATISTTRPPLGPGQMAKYEHEHGGPPTPRYSPESSTKPPTPPRPESAPPPARPTPAPTTPNTPTNSAYTDSSTASTPSSHPNFPSSLAGSCRRHRRSRTCSRTG